MRWLAGFLLFGALAVAACETFYTARFPIVVTSRMVDDTLTVYVNGKTQSPTLHNGRPTHQYRPRVRTEVSGITGVEVAVVHVSAYSHKLQQMSRTDSRQVATDRPEHFEFSPFDFLP